jgi:hypothetical protein
MSPRSSACSRGRYVLEDGVDIQGSTGGEAEGGWSIPESAFPGEEYLRKNLTSSLGFMNFE